MAPEPAYNANMAMVAAMIAMRIFAAVARSAELVVVGDVLDVWATGAPAVADASWPFSPLDGEMVELAGTPEIALAVGCDVPAGVELIGAPEGSVAGDGLAARPANWRLANEA